MKTVRFVSTTALAVALAATFPTLARAEDSSTSGGTSTDTIVVTATRSGDPVPASLIGGSVTVIDNQMLEDRQTRVLSDVLRDVPGVEVNRTGAIGGVTDVRIRGSEANQVLVFIDGIKADDPNDGQFDFATLLADEAARVEVLRGQQSSLYGSDAIGGVISYTTLSGKELPGISLRAEGGSMGTWGGGARVAGAKGDFDYALSSSYYHTDGYAVVPGSSRNIGSDSLGVSSKFDWTPAPNFKLIAIGRYSLTEADMVTENAAQTNPVMLNGYPIATASDYTYDANYNVVRDYGDYYHNIGWYGRVGAQWDLFDKAWTQTLDLTLADTTRNGYDLDAFNYGDHGRRWRGSYNSVFRFGSEHLKNRLTVGVDAERQQYAASYSGSHTIDSLGVVTQDDLTVDDRLAISASGRIDANSWFEGDATFRVTGSYRFPTGTRLHAAYGTGVKNPDADQLWYYSNTYVGNPNLKPESSRGYEIGIEQKLMQDHVTLGLTWFDNRFTDQIAFDGLTTINLPGRSRQRGLESWASARLRDWRIDVSYTYLDAPQTLQMIAGPASANPLYPYTAPATAPLTFQAIRRPKNVASANLTWAPASLPVSATVTLRYNGTQNDYAYDGNWYDKLLVGLKGYTLVNLGATYDINRHFQIFGRVENLGDVKYQEVFGYAAMGRAAYGGARVRF